MKNGRFKILILSYDCLLLMLKLLLDCARGTEQRSSHRSKDQRREKQSVMMTAPHFSEPGYCLVTQPSLDICSLQLHKQRGRKLYKCIESEEGIVSQLSREREGGDRVSVQILSHVSFSRQDLIQQKYSFPGRLVVNL